MLSSLLSVDYLRMVNNVQEKKSCIHDCVSTTMTDLNYVSTVGIYYFTGAKHAEKGKCLANEDVEESLRIGLSINLAPPFNSLLKIKNIL